jgi:hypothetical protein
MDVPEKVRRKTKRATGFSTLWPLRNLKTLWLCVAFPKRTVTTQHECGGSWRGKVEEVHAANIAQLATVVNAGRRFAFLPQRAV